MEKHIVTGTSVKLLPNGKYEAIFTVHQCGTTTRRTMPGSFTSLVNARKALELAHEDEMKMHRKKNKY